MYAALTYAASAALPWLLNATKKSASVDPVLPSPDRNSATPIRRTSGAT